MIVLYVLLGILGLLLLLLAVPAGAWIRYSSEGMCLKVIYGPLRIGILPKKNKKPKKKKEKKEKPKEKKKKVKETPKAPGETDLPKKGGSVKDLLEYVPVGLNLLGAIRRRLLLRKLVVLVNLAGDDPCDLATLYGKANGALATATVLLERAFRIRKRDMQVYCDFLADSTEVYAELEIAACPLRLIAVAVRYGIQALKIFLKQQKMKKAVQ